MSWGKPFSLRYSTNGGSSFSIYHYATNAQGDVEGIFFTRKNTKTEKQEVHWMGHYTYDAWGNILTITDANGNPPANPANLMLRNPIRYRGYYYDSETGFYYLQSRYHDPANHRFINADSYASTGQGFLGFNMFAYCNNSPVLYSDYSGHALNSNITVAIFDVGSNYWDVTMEVDAALFEECMIALALFEEELIGQKERSLSLYLYFYSRVKSEAAWDIKLDKPWRDTIGTPFPGSETKIVYHNIVLTPHNLADLTYGVLGGFYGFDLATLYTGSFVAAELPEYGTADWEHEVIVDWLYISIGYDIAPKPKKGG